MLYVLLCRKAPNWCGTWWSFGPVGWFARAKHELECKGRRG